MKNNSDNLVPVFIPALGMVLHEHERQKGSPLSRKEVEGIRDECTIVVMEQAQAHELDKSRGFTDIDPENCWTDWINRKAEFIDRRIDQPSPSADASRG